MDWSFELLSVGERELLPRLSAFAGGFLEAAAHICADEDEERALALVGRFVDVSLVLAEERLGAMRYRLLETVRQYAGERLDALGETAEIRRRHARYFLAFATEMGAALRGSEQATSLDRMEREHDNLRAALAWSRDAGEPEQELRLAAALWRFSWMHGHVGEGRGWLDGALERGPQVDAGVRAPALTGAAGLA